MDRRMRDELMGRLRTDADRICLRFGLRYRSIDPERANVKRRYGICYDDGSIKIRLIHAATGAPLKYSSLVNTLCHELAHLKHFNHGPGFKAFYLGLLAWARHEGIYRPAKPRALDPRPEPARPDQRWPAPAVRPTRSPQAGLPVPPRSPRPTREAPVQLDLFAGG